MPATFCAILDLFCDVCNKDGREVDDKFDRHPGYLQEVETSKRACFREARKLGWVCKDNVFICPTCNPKKKK